MFEKGLLFLQLLIILALVFLTHRLVGVIIKSFYKTNKAGDKKDKKKKVR